MKRLLNVDDGWLAWVPNCPPQGNLGGGVDGVFDLEAVARRWRMDLGRSGGVLVSSRTANSCIPAGLGGGVGHLTNNYVQSFVL